MARREEGVEGTKEMKEWRREGWRCWRGDGGRWKEEKEGVGREVGGEEGGLEGPHLV